MLLGVKRSPLESVDSSGQAGPACPVISSNDSLCLGSRVVRQLDPTGLVWPALKDLLV